MKDPQHETFNQRLRRIEKIHRRGGGFEAEGTLGQSYYTEQERRRGIPVLRPAVYMVFTVVASKAALLLQLGPEDYTARVAGLEAGTAVEQAGAMLMAPDPVSLAMAEWVTTLLESPTGAQIASVVSAPQSSGATVSAAVIDPAAAPATEAQ